MLAALGAGETLYFKGARLTKTTLKITDAQGLRVIFNGEEYTYGEEDPTIGTLESGVHRLNVRTGAGMEHEVIDQLCPGEEVYVIGTEGDWYQIIVPEKTGYVHSDYLNVIANATNETDAALLQMFMMMFIDSSKLLT